MTKQGIEKVRSEGRTLLTEIESKELLRGGGINIVDTKLAISKEDAANISAELGFPVALKIASPDIVHKSDIGGVKLGLKTVEEVIQAYDDILEVVGQSYPHATIHGISVQKMAPPGLEVIIGVTKDVQFGPVMMFGLGGILVEILKDVSFRVVPLDEKDAREMVREIKGFPLLQGYRGQEPVDVPALENLILKVSNFVERTPEIKEIDLNPVFAYSTGAVAVDARVILEGI
jgi:acyl-CoA synthetase (NDP forming)